jgi:integrase/recombinase XerC
MTEDLQKFLEYLEKEKKYSAHTLRAYKDDISSFYFFLNQSQIEPSEVQYDEIRAWIVSLSEEGMINRSINRKISALKTYYTFLQKIKKNRDESTSNASVIKDGEKNTDSVFS